MTVSTNSIARKDLTGYPKPVVDVLLEAINEYEVPYRLLDGRHLRLYCGDRSVTPFKASASRDAEYTLPYLHDWLTENWQPWAERKQVSEESLSALAARFSNGYEDDAPEPQQEPDDVAAQQSPEPEPEPEWVEHRSGSGKSHGFDTDGSRYRCQTCGYIQYDRRGLHLHAITHSDEHEDVVRKRAESRREVEKHKRLLDEQQETHLNAALAALAEHHGYALVPLGQQHLAEGLQQEVESLREQVETLTHEKEEAEARLALVREAFGA